MDERDKLRQEFIEKDKDFANVAKRHEEVKK